MAKAHRVILVDPKKRDLQALATSLEEAGYVVESHINGAEAFDRALEHTPDALITEYRLEGMGGLQLVQKLHRERIRLPIIMLTGDGKSETAIEAIKAGAFDYLTKPVDTDELIDILHDAIEAAQRMSKPVELSSVYEEQDTLIGQSRAMTRVYKELGRISSTPVTVLIRGETGTGKELIARALFQHGHRAHKPFITVNCAAIPENLLESELFGHEKGSFTGATNLRIGKFEQAHNATLFLDEIGDMNLSLQAKLLRVLQEKQIQRVGGRNDIPVDARIIAATHRNLEQMISQGEFRADLFYRLNVACIIIPPLRERREDIPILIDYFMSRFGAELQISRPAITREASLYLQAQSWPGNIRQLQNILRKALLKARDYAIDIKTLTELLAESDKLIRPARTNSLTALIHDMLQKSMRGELEAAYPAVMDHVEQELLAEAIQLSGGNQAKAARWLGISRLTLREKLHLYGLHPQYKTKSP